MEDLLEVYAEINENGFTIDIETAAAEWNECIKKLGDQDTFDYMSDYLCGKYEEMYGKKFSIFK